MQQTTLIKIMLFFLLLMGGYAMGQITWHVKDATGTASYTLPTVKGTTGQVLSIADETTGTTTWTTPSASGGSGGSGTDSQTLSLLAGSTSTTIINLNGAGSTSSSLTLVAGDNITLTENTTTGVISITATGSSGGGGGGGITLVTEAEKNAMTSATNGTLVYQTDGFKGIYAKESDGWRHQGKEVPATLINIGNIDTTLYAGPVYQLDASHHTLIVEGKWTQQPFDLFTLPAASSCKGRIYSFYIINSHTGFNGFPHPYEENGLGVHFSNTDAYIRLDKKATDTDADRKVELIPAQRQFAVQSDGTDWREILTDKAGVEFFDTNLNDGD